jgi:FlaA1/EpsC-like NDP-sugar epimerase
MGYFMRKRLLDNLYVYYNSLSRSNKRLLLMVIDAIVCFIAIYGAFSLRNSVLPTAAEIVEDSGRIVFLIAIKLIIFRLKGMYRPIVRYTDLEFLSTAMQAVLYSSGILVFLVYLQGFWPLPRAVLLIDALLTLVLVIATRIGIRSLFRQLHSHVSGAETCQLVVIYGAGVSGSQLARSLAQEPNCQIIAFVDDNPELQQQMIQGIRVYSPADLHKLWARRPFNTVVLAMPALDALSKRKIIEKLETLPVSVKTIPPMRQLLSGEVSINQIRNVDVADLLGREEVLPYPELLEINVTGKSVLVTGAGGSIGSELCRQIALLEPKCLLLYELNEYALYHIDLELCENYPNLERVAYLGNITDREYFEKILKKHAVDTIYHAAAYKHVPLVEANAPQGVYNNAFGTLTAARCAIAASVKNFVLISTDKAVRPTNVMGASKRVAELIIQALANLPETPTRFAIVRFGNVLDSSGSVVPRFRRQIVQGKPITVTHPDITRYFMSIPEAVRLVIQAGAMAKGGEVFLLDMGDPVRIYDLAVQMIRLSGLEPGRDIEIRFTGLRPGEKLYEELLIDGDNVQPTKHPKIYCANERKLDWQVLQLWLDDLLSAIHTYDCEELVNHLKRLVPEYKPSRPSKLKEAVLDSLVKPGKIGI